MLHSYINHRKNKFAHGGFTIVELLIVIVVIGILAAITVVAYNGVQSKASSTKLDSSVKTYVTGIELYKAQNGTYPNTGSGCLGTAADYPAAEGFASGSCVLYVNGNTNSLINTNLNTALAPFLNAFPSFSTSVQQRDFGGGQIYKYRGVWVEINTSDYQIQYFKPGNQTCSLANTTRNYYSADNTTRCLILVST